MVTSTSKVRENRIRRMADRQGYALQKNPRRDPRALAYGTYQLVDIRTNLPALSQDTALGGYGFSLDEIEAWLTN